MRDIHVLRASWQKARRLRLKAKQQATLGEGQQLENVRKRLRDLAQILELLYGIYRNDKDGLYGDEFLAFVGDKVIRGWPGKDFPFYSKDAAAVAKEAGVALIAGRQDLPKELKGKLHYEHWTPISFFRDVFDLARDKEIALDRDDFYELLIHYYRVVWISGNEHESLDKKHRAARSVDTYDNLGIVVEHLRWGEAAPQ
jgi:hypothetical protein